MGLLDDAIREHLDLKRRRGADPTEIERAEREALGPVRRNRGDDAGELDPDAALYAPVGSAPDEPDEGVASDIVDEVGEHPAFDGEPDVDRITYDDPPTAEEAIPAREDLLDEEEPLPAEDDAHATRVMRTADIPPASERTAEFDVEEAFADDDPFADEPEPPRRHDDDDEDDDVLEETPEFLQDTPDHDRLWFEQRPPRDFDFDN